ncbi:MAG: hypothetical protein PVI30_17165 [Myxococcales bacterium]|jgi:hypothetical protein
MFHGREMFAALVAAAAVSGCAVEGADLQSSEDGGTPQAAAQPLVTVSGHVNGGLFTMARDPVQVCVVEPEEFDCVETDDIGQFEIEAPAHSQVALTFHGEKLSDTVRAFLTAGEDLELGNTRMANAAGLSGIAGAMGLDEDPDKGSLFFSGLEFVSVELEPASGERFFLDYGGNLIEDAQWVGLRGMGGFLNVEPGRVALRFERPNFECSFNPENTLSGWPHPEDPGLAIVPILPGYHTATVTMFCGAQ